MKIPCIVKLHTYIGANGQNYCPRGAHSESAFRHSVQGLRKGGDLGHAPLVAWRGGEVLTSSISEPLRLKMLSRALESLEGLTVALGKLQRCKSRFPWIP